MLAMAGWDVQDIYTFDLSAARGVVILLLAEALRAKRRAEATLLQPSKDGMRLSEASPSIGQSVI
jgi:hypothetical protein